MQIFQTYATHDCLNWIDPKSTKISVRKKLLKWPTPTHQIIRRVRTLIHTYTYEHTHTNTHLHTHKHTLTHKLKHTHTKTHLRPNMQSDACFRADHWACVRVRIIRNSPSYVKNYLVTKWVSSINEIPNGLFVLPSLSTGFWSTRLFFIRAWSTRTWLPELGFKNWSTKLRLPDPSIFMSTRPWSTRTRF